MPTIDFGFERAERQGREQGIEQGREEGREEGREQGKWDTAKKLLLEGVDERIICKAAQLTKQALAKIKRDLKQS